METRKKILIVDDEQINVEFFDLMLSKLGFVVEKAANGREALDKIKEFSPDLIMLDNIMPKMSGWEVTRILKNDAEYSQWREVPIVMFSAMDDVKDKIEGFELGIDDYITKPFNFSEVLARIRAVLRHHELIDQLKKRESRIELQEELNQKLLAYVEMVTEKFSSLCDTSAREDGVLISDDVQACQLEYEKLRKRIDELQEEAVRLKSREIAVTSLENELRKAYSE
ncbi:MAG TPA: response regulator [Treponemataceae bacterium]|jgi:DNA-binding response OmpR family regulator|nr:response regulator [Treponema sp.]OQB03347.1 MAG: Transcriptional activator protein CzcR [Spirochaetes bacterium ADurb.Bin215]HPA10902.1 response regulator [Treponemataceae bacterium]HPX14377.1 response regulator [Treponemataceae bacterium]HQB89277.1 response regulator [Treponemataceae bacterium]